MAKVQSVHEEWVLKKEEEVAKLENEELALLDEVIHNEIIKRFIKSKEVNNVHRKRNQNTIKGNNKAT